VLPVPKTVNPSEVLMFRPISILPIFSKVLEKIDNYLSMLLKSVIPAKQSGFRPKHSTTTALLKVSDDLMRALDDGMSSCLILLHYTRTFYTVFHPALVAKLRYYGVADDAVKLLDSYLSGRVQRVCLGREMSGSLGIQRDVPQGSIIGPILFSMYTAEFAASLVHMISHEYADDLQLFFMRTIFKHNI